MRSSENLAGMVDVEPGFFLGTHRVDEKDIVGHGGFGMAAMRAGNAAADTAGVTAELIDLEGTAAT